MTGRGKSSGAKEQACGDGGRKARLAAELRANLAKRKAQARSRRGGDGDTRPEGIAAATGPASDKEGPRGD